MSLVHASLVQWHGLGVLIRGKSGSGKSQLCLQLIDDDAKLVADDQVHLTIENSKLIGSPPQALAGKLEIRGLGIIEVQHIAKAEIKLVIDLLSHTQIPRMPEPHELSVEILGQTIPSLCLDPQSPATMAKLRASLAFFKLR